jgi:hypothetical protein
VNAQRHGIPLRLLGERLDVGREPEAPLGIGLDVQLGVEQVQRVDLDDAAQQPQRAQIQIDLTDLDQVGRRPLGQIGDDDIGRHQA